MYLYSRRVNVGPQGLSFIDVFLLCALIGVSLYWIIVSNISVTLRIMFIVGTRHFIERFRS